MTDHFGSGIHLNESSSDGLSWDLDVDESGDIRTTSGLDELKKDLSFSLASRLEGILGNPLTPTTMNRIQAIVDDGISQDDRISRVIALDVQRVEGRPNTVQVQSQLNTTEGVVDLIFMIDN